MKPVWDKQAIDRARQRASLLLFLNATNEVTQLRRWQKAIGSGRLTDLDAELIYKWGKLFKMAE